MHYTLTDNFKYSFRILRILFMLYEQFANQVYDAKTFVLNLNILPHSNEYAYLELVKSSSPQLNDIRIDPKIHHPPHVKLPDGSIRIGPINRIAGDIFMGCQTSNPSNIKSLFLKLKKRVSFHTLHIFHIQVYGILTCLYVYIHTHHKIVLLQ